MTVEIHQLVHSFVPADAQGNHAVRLQEILRRHGVVSDIWWSEARSGAGGRHFRHFDKRKKTGGPTYLLYHASTGSPLADWLVQRPETKLIDYHNVTPSSQFGPWEPHVGADLAAARRQIASLARHTHLALADSAYNEAELHEWGFKETAVVPIIMDLDALQGPADQATLDRLGEERKKGAVWLFVGRIAPNKAQHDILKSFAVYRRGFDPDARLHLVGGSSSHRYLTALESFVTDAGLSDAVSFCGKTTDAEMLAHYRGADVLVCLSDHEGFGVPLIEAMANDLPVVAYASTSVPETVGDGGLLLDSKEPTTVAAAVHRVVTDDVVRGALVARGRRRRDDFSIDRTEQKLMTALAPLLRA